MILYSREDAAERAGVESPFLARLVDLGILAPHEPDGFSPADVRRVLLANSLEQAGIPLEGVGAAMQRGALSLDFLDAASYERFAALAPYTLGLVDLDEGVRVMAHVAAGVEIGERVQLDFLEVEGCFLPRFRSAGG